MADEGKVALITGGSRGIGRACALHLAKRGVNVAVASRTLTGSEKFEVSATIKESDVAAMPGSLEETAADARALGVRALPIKLDLLSREETKAAVEATLEEFGRIDILVNNGRFYGPGQQDLFEDTDLEYFDKANEANVMAPLHLIKLTMPSMIEQGGGVVVNLTSGSGSREVAAMPGVGGWGLNYSITKAAVARVTPGLAKELKRYNIAVISISPGNVVTERRVREAGKYGFAASTETGLSSDVPGAAVAFLATHPNAMFYSGKWTESIELCMEHGLLPPSDLPANEGPDVWGLPR